ncbi:MAG: hypothetical protein WC819_04855 [Parcubacteria group bacterium]
MTDKVITQIGSLPHMNVSEAVSYSLLHEIPFFPELPILGDSMLNYAKNPGKMSCLEEFKKHRFSRVKIQCIGPAILITTGCGENEALEVICNHITTIMDGLYADEVILFLDEPALGQAGFDYESIWDAIFSNFHVVRGVHCCGPMDWDILLRSSVVDMISFDASQFNIALYPYYRNGKKIAWGVERKEHVADFRAGDLITPPCGMSPMRYNVKDCTDQLINLKQIKDHAIKMMV